MFIKRKEYIDKLELLDLYRNKNKANVDRINDYKEQVYNLRKTINNFEKQQNNLYEQNQKLTNWIVQILKEFGTVETRERHIQIPICRKKIERSYIENSTDIPYMKEERIEIPSITLIKLS